MSDTYSGTLETHQTSSYTNNDSDYHKPVSNEAKASNIRLQLKYLLKEGDDLEKNRDVLWLHEKDISKLWLDLAPHFGSLMHPDFDKVHFVMKSEEQRLEKDLETLRKVVENRKLLMKVYKDGK